MGRVCRQRPSPRTRKKSSLVTSWTTVSRRPTLRRSRSRPSPNHPLRSRGGRIDGTSARPSLDDGARKRGACKTASTFWRMIATPARGTLFGNRGGRFHRDDQTLAATLGLTPMESAAAAIQRGHTTSGVNVILRFFLDRSPRFPPAPAMLRVPAQRCKAFAAAWARARRSEIRARRRWIWSSSPSGSTDAQSDSTACTSRTCPTARSRIERSGVRRAGKTLLRWSLQATPTYARARAEPRTCSRTEHRSRACGGLCAALASSADGFRRDAACGAHLAFGRGRILGELLGRHGSGGAPVHHRSSGNGP